MDDPSNPYSPPTSELSDRSSTPVRTLQRITIALSVLFGIVFFTVLIASVPSWDRLNAFAAFAFVVIPYFVLPLFVAQSKSRVCLWLLFALLVSMALWQSITYATMRDMSLLGAEHFLSASLGSFVGVFVLGAIIHGLDRVICPRV